MDSLEQKIFSALETLEKTENQLKREKQFAAEAEQRWVRNLAAFKEYYPDIYDSIIEFKAAQSLPIYVTKSGHGNIRDEETGLGIYGDNPVEESRVQVEENLRSPNVNRIDFSHYAKVNPGDKRLHMQFLRKLGGVAKKGGKAEQISSLGDSFPTAVIFGVGLGYHLEILTSQVNFNYTFIIEPSFQNFFLSLYCTDWSQIIERVDKNSGSLFFHLGVSYDDFIDDLINITKSVGAVCLTKCFCYRHLPTQKNTLLIKKLFERIYEIHGGYGFYNDSLTSIAHTVINTEKDTHLLESDIELSETLRKTPVYIVGNGPSLDDSIEFIKETQKDAIVVAAGTAFQTLYQQGVETDFHVLIERPKVTYDVLINTLSKDAYSSTNLLTMSLVYPDACDLYEWVGMSTKGTDAGGDLLQLVSKLERGRFIGAPSYPNPLVSNTALSFFLRMGFKQIYLFGVDNGYLSGGRHHASGSIYYKGELSSYVPKKANRKLPGNLEGEVWATDLLAMSCYQMQRALKHKSSDNVECFNVGDGAYIEGAKPLRPEHLLPEFNSIDKNEVIEGIKGKQFSAFQFRNFEKYIGIESYEELCDSLIKLSDNKPSSREDALDFLLKQSRLLYSYRTFGLSHIFHMLDGELQYFHCTMLSLLFHTDDEETSIELFNDANTIWIEFLESAKKDFRNNWRTKCDYSLEQQRENKAFERSLEEQS
ncbi:MAG: 6-hydroxymethylpterin diphosphokinase MptE-like protein [Pseudomonadota bacterium]